MTGLTTAYCLLGSNQGDRLGLLRQAVFALAETEGVEIAAVSAVYETAPWGIADQPSFLNAAAALRTRLSTEALLDRFQEIERRLGRARKGEQWGPRLIDLDLALYGNEEIRTERLTVPHPCLRERLFALVPLLDLAPELRDIAGALYADAARELRRKNEDLKKTAEGPQPEPVVRLSTPLVREARSIEERAPHASRESGTEETLTQLFRSHAPEDTERLAERIGERLRGGEVLALAGNLGAGKTCFARGIARGLRIPGPITSPSYVLVKSYEGRLTLHHGDFYRLAGSETPASESVGAGMDAGTDAGAGAASKKGTPAGLGGRAISAETPPEPPDLASLGLEDYLDDPAAVLLIEWADRYPAWLEPPFTLIEIAGAGDQPRWLLMRRIG